MKALSIAPNTGDTRQNVLRTVAALFVITPVHTPISNNIRFISSAPSDEVRRIHYNRVWRAIADKENNKNNEQVVAKSIASVNTKNVHAANNSAIKNKQNAHYASMRLIYRCVKPYRCLSP
jgi:hypothetical protein